MPRTHTKIIKAGPFQRRLCTPASPASAASGARIAGFSNAAKLQTAPHQAHARVLEASSSLSVVMNPNARTKPERHVSQSSQGMNNRGGAIAHAQPDRKVGKEGRS